MLIIENLQGKEKLHQLLVLLNVTCNPCPSAISETSIDKTFLPPQMLTIKNCACFRKPLWSYF